jgi:hypothetical protein
MPNKDFRVRNGLHVSANAYIANSITNVTDVQFNVGANTTQAVGKLAWAYDDRTLEVGLTDQVTMQIGQETLLLGQNLSGSSITNGTLVMISGASGNGGAAKIAPAIANGSVPSKLIIGLATENIANNTNGFVTTYGKVRGINTSSFVVGDELYADPDLPGILSNTKPVAPNLKVSVGTVLNQHATNGVVLVRMNYGSAIEEDENVHIVDIQPNQGLLWSAANNRFENKSIQLSDLGISDGSTGQVLTTDGAGTFTFTTVTGGSGGNSTNSFTTFISTSGSTTASNTNDALTIVGSNTISTSISGDTLTITMPASISISNVIGNTGSNVRSSTDTTLRIVGGANTTTTVSGNTVTIASTQTITETLDSVLARGNTTTKTVSVGNFNAESANFGGNVEIDGNLTVSGSTITVSATSFAVTDNMIYLNQGIAATITNAVGNGTRVVYTANNNYTANMAVAVFGVNPSAFNLSNGVIFAANATTFTVNSAVTASYIANGTARGKTSANPDLGLAAGYNDGTYHHTGLFRDATDGAWKFFDNYTPEPDESVFIDTSNASFRLANVAANNFIGNVTSIANHGLDSLGDVILENTTALAIGDVLWYNGGEWENNADIAFYLSQHIDYLAPISRQSNTSAIVAISVGTTAPGSPAIGDLWVDTN